MESEVTENNIFQPSNSKVYGNEPQYSGIPIERTKWTKWKGLGKRNRYRKTGARFIGVLFHTFYYYWAENIVRYTGVFVL